MDQAFPRCFCTLQAINWTVGRPGNNARLELGLGPGGALLLFIWLQTGGREEEEIRPIIFLACSPVEWLEGSSGPVR